MTVNELCDKLSLTHVCGDMERDFNGVYVGDLLSRAMSHVGADNLWITIMANINVIAVATLTEPSAIILAEDVELADGMLEAAEENDITILQSSLSAYELCCRIHDLT